MKSRSLSSLSVDGLAAKERYVDEEAALGFKIWVAELELIVGVSRTKKVADSAKVFILLQKLVYTLDRTDRTEVREYQRRCEDALVDILLKGAPPPVRRLVCEALGKLYYLGDSLPLFSRVSSLQLFLGTREASGKETSEDIRLGALELMTGLYYSQGRSLSIGVLETMALAVKYCGKSSSGRTRMAALRLLSAAVEGVGGGHRDAAAVQNESFKALERMNKERDLSEPLKLGMADVFRAIAAAGGAQMWTSSLALYDFARSACLAGLQDPSVAVRTAYAAALGEIVTASTSEDARQSVAVLKAKSAKHAAQQEKALAAVVDQCVGVPFAEATAASDRPALTALAQAWARHLCAARAACGADEAAFVEPALRPLQALAAGCLAAGNNPERGLASPELELGMGIGGGERPHAQACVLYVLRAGAIELLGESGQRLMLAKMTTLLWGVGEGSQAAPEIVASAPVAIVALEAAALLVEALGEVGPEAAEALEAAAAGKLVGPHAALRLQAASALAALAAAEPGRAAKLVKSALNNLRSAADKVVDAAAAGPDKSRPLPGTPRGPGSGRFKLEMNELHGWALASAALVASTAHLPLGLPSHYLKAAMQLATALIEAPRTQFPAATCLEREAGYVVLGALCCVALPELSAAHSGDTDDLLSLWAPALGSDATAALDVCMKSKESYADFTVAAEIWWRTAAVQSLSALICALPRQALSSTSSEESGSMVNGILDLLRPMLSMLSTHTALRHPVMARGGAAAPLAGAAAMLQLRLLQAYTQLPPTAIAAAGDIDALGSLCVDAIKAVGAGGTGALELLIPALQSSLDHADDNLGPWQMAKDPLERALLQFQGATGGPMASAWQAGLRTGVGYALMSGGDPSSGGGSSTSSSGPNHHTHASQRLGPYPQPVGLAPALFAAQAQALGAAVLCAAPAAMQLSALDALLELARSFPPTKKDKDSSKRVAAVLAAATPVLAGLGGGAASSSYYCAGRGSPEAAERVIALAEATADEAREGVLLQRCTAGLHAAAVRLGGDAASGPRVQRLCREAAETASLPRRAALAMGIGAACRAVGGLGLAGVLPLAAETLGVLAQVSDSSIAPAVLHALMTCLQAAGLAAVAQVKGVLGVLQNMLLNEDIYSVPGLLPAVGRLANATVAILGPDFILGSAAYDACRSVVAELRAPKAAEVPRPEDSLAARLECVLYAQMLVLFAPHAVPAAQHVNVLVSTLPSRQPQLRKAAADTLRHLAERDAGAVLAQRIEPALLAALDGETDPATAAQLQATLRTLLMVGAAQHPSSWVALLGGIVAAAGPSDAAQATPGDRGGMAGAGEGSDEESTAKSFGGGTGGTKGPPSPPYTAGKQMWQQPFTTPRLRTRVFAARCLLQVPQLAAAADPRHTDLAAAEANVMNGDWLVTRTQSLVELGFRMATGQLDALRALGVDLMLSVLSYLGDVPDPLSPTERLLAQFQAQYVSTLRASLSQEASPEVSAAGAALAAAFLEKGLAGGDAVVMERLMSLLCAPLSGWAGGTPDPAQAAYAEWVAARARIALLESHAHCAALVGSGDDEAARGIVLRAQGPFLTLLVDCWTGVVHDFAVLDSRPSGPDFFAEYKLSLYGKGGAASRAPHLAAVAEGVGPALRRAWPAALEAACSTLAHDRTVSYGAAGKERHAALLDVAIGATYWGEEEGSDGTPAMKALLRLTAPRFVKEGWLAGGLLGELTGVVERVVGRGGLSSEGIETAAAVVDQISAALPGGGWEGEGGAAADASIVAAAQGCVAAAGRSALALAAALSALSHRVATAAPGGDAAYATLLHRLMAEALGVLGDPARSQEQLEAATAHVKAAAKAAAARAVGLGGPSPGPSVVEVLTAAAVTAARQTRAACEASSVAKQEAAAAAGHRAGANLACMLALGAMALETTTDGDEEHSGSSLAAADEKLAEVGENGGGGEEFEDWGEDDEWTTADATTTAAAAADAPIVAPMTDPSPAQLLCLEVLGEATAVAAPSARVHVLRAAVAFFQSMPPPLWAAQAAATVLPPTLAALHAALATGRNISDGPELECAVVGLMVGVLVCNLGGAGGVSALGVVVPILVGCAAGEAMPALTAAAVRLLTALGDGPMAGAFRETVAALPDDAKQRLQRALVAAAGAAAPGHEKEKGAAAAPARTLPSIQLKRFVPRG